MDNDCVSREAALQALSADVTVKGHENVTAVINYMNAAIDRIKRLPPAEPERKKERWTGDFCPVCGISKYNFISFDFDDPAGYAKPFGTWNFCPRCGADLRGEPDER